MTARKRFKGEGAVQALEIIAYVYMGLAALGAIGAFVDDEPLLAAYAAVAGVVGGVFLLVMVGVAQSLFMIRHSLREIRTSLSDTPPPTP